MHRFYLGTHKPVWLSRFDIPMFVSRNSLVTYKKLPRALGRWALDSGGFTEISKYGRWRTDIETFIADVRRFRDEVGNMDWSACQDWMCEPHMLELTGGSVESHQLMTTTNYIELRHRAPDIPWAPVLQGWGWGDHVRHAELYKQHGVDLTKCPAVGIGSVCRRQGTTRGILLITEIAEALPGVRLHGFGFKTDGLLGLKELPMDFPLYSSDSLAWSYSARRAPPLPGCRHKSCSNCSRWAMNWRENLMNRMGEAHA